MVGRGIHVPAEQCSEADIDKAAAPKPPTSSKHRSRPALLPFHTIDDMTLNIPTPPKCTADFCLIPMGDGASVSSQIADVQRLIAKSGLSYHMHSAGTTLEGSWDDVMKVVGQAHSMLHEKGTVRIQSDIRVGSRTDKKQSFTDKVSAVEKLLAADPKD